MTTRRYTHLDANGTTVIAASLGQLIAVIINTPGAAANRLTLYDNSAASGDVIAIIDTTLTASPFRDFAELTFRTGLTAVLATGTAADVTVVTQ